METISQVLFWVANSLLIPDILLLLLLFIRALLLVGGIYNQYMAKRHPSAPSWDVPSADSSATFPDVL